MRDVEKDFHRSLGYAALIILALAAILFILIFTTPGHSQDVAPSQFCQIENVRCTSAPFGTIKTHMRNKETGAQWIQYLPVPHKTADRAFWLWTIADVASTVADGENTFYALRKAGVRESNPLLGSHPTRARYYPLELGLCAFQTYLAYRWKRADDAERAAGFKQARLPWWAPQLAITASHGAGVAFTLAFTGR